MTEPAPPTEERRIRAAVVGWGRARWPGCRVLHELVLGERRVDLVFVMERDLVGAEIKSSVDTLARLATQMKEYARYLPEVWLAIAARWQDDERVRYRGANKLVVFPGSVDAPVVEYRKGEKPHRDELVCSRLLELLWYEEACRIAVRTDVLPSKVHKQIRRPLVLKMLARLLTGNEIIAEVCRELRARPLVGLNSDGAIR